MEPFLEGIFVGLGIALPVGAISLLVMDIGVRRGFAPSLAAGGGVATSHVIHGLLAVVLVSFFSEFVRSNAELLLLIGGLTLVIYGLVGLYRFRTRTEPEESPEDRTSVATYFVFTGLGLLGSGSIVYFAAVIIGRSGELIAAAGDKTAYLIGVAGAALGWHALMAAYSGTTGHYLPAGARVLTRLVGSLIVLVLGMRFVLDVF